MSRVRPIFSRGLQIYEGRGSADPAPPARKPVAKRTTSP